MLTSPDDETLTHAADALEVELRDPLLAAQFELEGEMIEDGAHRYWAVVNQARPHQDREGRWTEGEESRTPAAQCLLRRSLNPVRARLQELLDAAPKRGRPPIALKYLRMVDVETVAFLALKRAMDCFSLSPDMLNMTLRLGRVLEDEVRLRTFEEKGRGLLLHIQRNFKTSNFAHQRRVLNALAARAGVDLGEPWDKQDVIQVGSFLLTVILEVTGMFELVNEGEGTPHQKLVVRPTEATKEWVRKRDMSAQFLMPTFMPMVVPPTPWTGPTGGGYRYGLARKLRLVKNRNRGYQQELKHWDMPEVYRAVNALQDTAWAVNTDVLPLMAEAARAGNPLGGLPETAELDIPPPPPNVPRVREERTEEQHAQLVAWKSVARQAHEANVDRRQRGITLARTISVAERYASFERIYFPYTLDFRGRAYPVSVGLQPQGCDYQKALLRFSEGKALGEQGACWLAVHGANLMAECPTTGAKLDKAPLQERIDWVLANEAAILACAADPYATDFWTQADGPWQFLAFCHEWAGYVREGDAFESRLPIALDGSCNGLQHFSAMLRDEVGGSAVNLIPHEYPADIYMEVCNRALEQVRRDCLSEDPEKAALAQRWLDSGQVNRDLCKRPVMTMPYGSKVYGIRDQLAQKLRERKFEFVDQQTGEVTDAWAECGYMANAIWAALGQVVVKAREAMDWLQDAARVAAKDGLPVTWVTPDGLLILQDYKETYEKRVETKVAGRVYWPRVREELAELSKHRQQNGIAPNFVHSLDGAALRRCVNAALDVGIGSFAMIHDSYGTHAADTEVFFRLIRTSFSRMYQETDVLGQLRDDLIRQLDIETVGELKPLPSSGTLDLSALVGSDFFFA